MVNEMVNKSREILTLTKNCSTAKSGRLPVPMEIMKKANIGFRDCCTVEASDHVVTYRFIDNSTETLLFNHVIGKIAYAEHMPDTLLDGEPVSMKEFLHFGFRAVKTRAEYMYLNDIRFEEIGDKGEWRASTHMYIDTIIGGVKAKKAEKPVVGPVADVRKEIMSKLYSSLSTRQKAYVDPVVKEFGRKTDNAKLTFYELSDAQLATFDLLRISDEMVNHIKNMVK